MLQYYCVHRVIMTYYTTFQFLKKAQIISIKQLIAEIFLNK